MAPMNTVTATTMDPNIRNQMSIMAWGMAALCAWVLILAAAHASHNRSDREIPYNVSVPINPVP